MSDGAPLQTVRSTANPGSIPPALLVTLQVHRSPFRYMLLAAASESILLQMKPSLSPPLRRRVKRGRCRQVQGSWNDACELVAASRERRDHLRKAVVTRQKWLQTECQTACSRFAFGEALHGSEEFPTLTLTCSCFQEVDPNDVLEWFLAPGRDSTA